MTPLYKYNGLGCIDFARHYFRYLGWFLFLQVLRCFTSLGCLPLRDHNNYLLRGYPIRRSTDKRLFAPTRSLSQLTTSFVDNLSQGIHHMHLVAWSHSLIPSFDKIFQSDLYALQHLKIYNITTSTNCVLCFILKNMKTLICLLSFQWTSLLIASIISV